MKKVIIILIIIILGGGALALGVWFQLRKTPPLPAAPGVVVPSGGLPIAPPAGTVPTPSFEAPLGGSAPSFGIVSEVPIRDYFVDNENTVWLISSTGTILSVKGGVARSVGAATASNLLSAAFSYNGEKILFSYGDSGSLSWSIAEASSGIVTPLASGIRAAVWAPNNERIAYMAPSGQKNALYTLDTLKKGARPQAILSFNSPVLVPSWQDANTILLAEPPSGLLRAGIWRVDLRTGTIREFIGPLLGLLANPDGTSGLSVTFHGNTTERGGVLRVLYQSGTLYRELTQLSLPEKCTFRNARIGIADAVSGEVVCGIPRDASLFARALLPDDYRMKKIFSSDDIVSIDLATGTISPLFEDASFALDAVKLKSFGENLFFVNRRDSKLYAVKLK